MVIHTLQPFLFDSESDPDMDLSDIKNEILVDSARQDIVLDWLKGVRPFDDVLDMCSDNKIDPDGYIDMIENNVDIVLCQGLDLDDFGLLDK